MMPTMSLAFVILLLALLWCPLILLCAIRGKWKKRKSIERKMRLPPVGNLPHRTVHSLAKTCGPIMYLKLGRVPALIVSSPQAAQEILKTHDVVFASRPPMEATYMQYSNKGVALTPYGPYWRTVRKICTSKLLSNAKIDSFKMLRKEELSLSVKSLRHTANAGATANLGYELARVAGNIMCGMVFRGKYMDGNTEERGFKELFQEALKLGGAFNLADFIPFLKPFDIQGLRRRMKVCLKHYDEFCEKLIGQRILQKGCSHRMDFVDTLLFDSDFQADRKSIKAIISNMLVGGLDTSSNTIEWALSELFRHPRVMKKVQEELVNVVGMDRLVEESDLAKLEYLDMVIKETLRLHPVGPLLIHEAMVDCIINGFHISKGSRVLINVFAIGRDPTSWSNAEEFFPERFIGTNIEVTGHDFQLLPFGSRRRGGPARQLRLTMFRLILAQLLHCFDWELPNGTLPSELDMGEKFGLTVPRANSLLAVPTYRLHCDVS